MMEKFPDFNEYQLAKYNNEASTKRKRKQNKSLSLKKEIQPNQAHGRRGNAAQSSEPNADMTPTIKQMIRLLHISAPVGPVMVG